jgi:hypothetical protein
VQVNRVYIQLRLEAFNAFNHPNFNNKHYDVHVDSFPNQYNAKTDPIVFSKPDNWGNVFQPVQWCRRSSRGSAWSQDLLLVTVGSTVQPAVSAAGIFVTCLELWINYDP